ncbi:MAG: hypothetical protein QHH17_05730 [Candidatus Bathyarchaeota archaeon]|jgi:hypothetical protein|nr:hypothetical protein [Candidatus Bathyarchaeota archaeon]
MFKTFREKIALSGITVLMVGVALLVFTFISAYGFLTQSLSIMASENLVKTFGEALAPLIATCIRIMYLGVMGWVGSLLTIRGVTIIAHAPQVTPTVSQKEALPELKPQPQPQLQKAKAEKPKAEKPKEEVKPQEPEMVVIPPEQISQPPPEPKQPQQNSSPQQ